LAEADRQSLLRAAREIQAELTVHPPQPLGIPRMPIQPESIRTLPEAPATLRGYERREGSDYWRIPSGPVHEGPVVRGPPQSHSSTGPLNRKVALTDQMGHHFPPLSRP